MMIPQDYPNFHHDGSPVTTADAEQARARFALRAGDRSDAARAFDLAAIAYEAAGATSMSTWCRRQAESARKAAG